MFTAAVIGDVQAPYEDSWAVSVCAQILHDVKPDLLVINGDWSDLRCLSRYPLTHDEEDSRLVHDLGSEVERSRSTLKEFIRHVKAKKVKWTDGNHEWRVLRAFEKDDRALRAIGLKEVKEAISSPRLMKLNELGIEYIGPYPKGMWLHPKLQPHENVWVEHGYAVRKESGYTCTNLMRDRMSSVIVNHCEKLAGPLWKRAQGRDYFGIENGNLSVIGEPGRGEGLYGGVPHSIPEYMNHRQGFSILYHTENQWSPFTVKIRDGKAVWGGKLYKA